MALDLFKQRAKKDRQEHGGRLPPGQKLTDGWPVLHYGGIPSIDLSTWKFSMVGLVEDEVHFSWDDFMALPQTTLRSDIHCVTHWSKFDNDWTGVSIGDLMAHARVRAEAKHVMVHSYGGYTTNIPLSELLDSDVIFAHTHNGAPLEKQHGWPLRLVVPKLYFWKSAKWVRGMVFMGDEKPGFWEMYGYHFHGDPWTEERYS
ncbi:MAG TPA: sulfite oxidase-like oxidoreductase [Dehalococcoidia bacterium]|nr:sulfite oxidase-like oxidoreductase [Dehalococcoidia bacterium]